ncbi:MAG: SPFH domain-containing protein [Armatimonadetes bacterium]|nr:SPFH domain-containing protein [Armatimonadota bacterium]
MSIFDKIRGEFIDIIEWLDDTQDTIVYRFERHNNEIKYGAQLTVRESQVAVFVNEGVIADVFEPGRYELETQNLPILTTLKGWKYGFNSPFKAEVYFVNTKRFTDLKWGTSNPVMMRDQDFGIVRVRAFGTYAMRVCDAATFLRELAGTDWQFTVEEVQEHIRNQIVSSFAEGVAKAQIPVIDLAAKYSDLGATLLDSVAPGMKEVGIELLNFRIENVSVPEEVEAAIDKRSSMGAVGNLQAYTQFQAANAMEKAAENPGGLGAAGIGMGVGAAMGQAMQGAFNQPAAGGQAPPPVPAGVQFHLAIDGSQHGPFTVDQLKGMIGSTLHPDTLVWTAGMPEWKKASEVDVIKALFGSVPPPLPPQ